MSRTLRLALFGHPVEHSLSPQIHRRFGQQLDIDLSYQAIDCTAAEFGPRFAAFIVGGGSGANLTVPLKHAGLGVCQQIDAGARAARAINTLVRADHGWYGHNTDGPGLLLDLDNLGIPIAGRRILILGAGGATAGILGPLLGAKPALVTVLNRTGARAEALAGKFAQRGCIVGGGFEQADDLSGFDLLLQATSSGHDSVLPPLRRGWLTADAAAYDLNYGPAHRAFAAWCDENDLDCHDGLGMLVGQAALAFEIWTGQRPQTAPVQHALRQRNA